MNFNPECVSLLRRVCELCSLCVFSLCVVSRRSLCVLSVRITFIHRHRHPSHHRSSSSSSPPPPITPPLITIIITSQSSSPFPHTLTEAQVSCVQAKWLLRLRRFLSYAPTSHHQHRSNTPQHKHHKMPARRNSVTTASRSAAASPGGGSLPGVYPNWVNRGNFFKHCQKETIACGLLPTSTQEQMKEVFWGFEVGEICCFLGLEE